MKQTKDEQLKFRVTAEFKEKVVEYCEKHNMTISEFLRFVCESIIYNQK